MDFRDAEDAIYARDGYDLDGYKLRVEATKGSGPRGPGGRPMHGSDDRSRRGRRSGYKVMVTGLPISGSWQDLKDHMREAGDILHADVNRDGTGVVEFLHHDDARYAIKKFDDTKFKSHEGESSYIRLREESSSRSRSRSRSPKRSRSSRKSRSRSPRKSRSRTRTKSPPSRSPSAGSRSD